MTLNVCGCIDKLCKTELLKDIIKFQCPGVMFIQMKIVVSNSKRKKWYNFASDPDPYMDLLDLIFKHIVDAVSYLTNCT